MPRSSLVSVAALLAAVASAAEAQYRHERRGLWLGLGLGPGSAEATCSVCDARTTGPTLHARVGGTVSRRALAGVEGTGWLTNGSTTDRTFLMVAAVGAFYPLPDRGLHLKGGLGYYQYEEESASEELSTQGLALQVGAGFDIRVLPGFSISPFAGLMLSGFSNPTRTLKASGQRLPLLSEMTVNLLQLGLAVTLH